MSFKAEHWAVHEARGLKPLERLLLLVLAEHADDRDCVWSSQDRLAHMVGTSPSTLRRCLARLERLGLLTHENRWAMDESTDTLRMTDVYQLHVGTRPTRGALKDCSRLSHPTGPHRPRESMSKQVDHHIEAHKRKVTVRKVGDVVNYATRLALTVITLADTLNNWFS
ncbi:helix-turn-helix domain-containing protein [Actinomyces oris]|uniref:helix-turn-helix domain-containing protein n=1 Tax=Actinomyces oris TaxID=544580 RepID=UPI0026EFAE8C|nr:helix-turn-helix domain-containing protein [Actinomyces oris]